MNNVCEVVVVSIDRDNLLDAITRCVADRSLSRSPASAKGR